MTTAETAEIAERYGVALPKTCEILNFPFNQFSHIWILKDNEWSVELTKHHAKFLPMQNVLAAPQFNEIAKLLPPFSNCSYQTIYQKTMTNELIYSENVEERICILVENGNIAQAAAELYLKLKSLNLL